MTYQDALTEARALNCMHALSAEYTRRWNALEDTLMGKLTIAEVDAIRTKAREERGDVMAAQLVLTMLGE